jgi:hypothetical protein
VTVLKPNKKYEDRKLHKNLFFFSSAGFHTESKYVILTYHKDFL